MAEVEAAGQIPEARSVASRHSGSASRDARETSTGRLCQPIMDWRSTVSEDLPLRPDSDILLYQTEDGQTRVEVRLRDETVCNRGRS